MNHSNFQSIHKQIKAICPFTIYSFNSFYNPGPILIQVQSYSVLLCSKGSPCFFTYIILNTQGDYQIYFNPIHVFIPFSQPLLVGCPNHPGRPLEYRSCTKIWTLYCRIDPSHLNRYPLIQNSGLLTIVTTTPTLQTTSVTNPYKYPKTVVPLVIYSFGSADYNLNMPFPGNGYMYLFMALDLGTLTSTTLYELKLLSFSPTQIKSVKASMFIVDLSMTDKIAFDAKFHFFNNQNDFYDFHAQYADAFITNFVKGFQYELRPPYTTKKLMGVHWEITKTSTLVTKFKKLSTLAGNSYHLLKTDVIFLGIYLNLLRTDEYSFQNFNIQTNYQPYSSYTAKTISFDFSKVFFGVTNFYVESDFSSTLPSFKYSFTYSSNQLVELSNTNSFQALNVTFIVINKLFCPFNYPIRRINTSTSLHECYDTCASTEFVTYDNATSGYLCQACSAPCVECFSATLCKSCITSMEVDETGGCTLKNTYANVSGTVDICNFFMTFCKTCAADGSACTACIDRYTLAANLTTCLSCASQIDLHCTECTLTECHACKVGYNLSTPTSCILYVPPTPPVIIVCADANCSKCTAANVSLCLACTDPEHVLVNGACSSLCGDGKKMGTEECDDANTDNFDGCSQFCKIEDDFTCQSITPFSATSMYFTSECVYSKPITFGVERIEKVIGVNKVRLYLSFPTIRLKLWEGVNMLSVFVLGGEIADRVKTITLHNPVTGISETKNMGSRLLAQFFSISQMQIQFFDRRLLQSQISSILSEYLLYEIEYFQSIEGQSITLSLNPSFSGKPILIELSSYQSSFNLVSSNNQLAHFYEESDYNKAEIIQVVSTSIGIGYLCFLILGSFVGNMLVTMELAFVMQMGYFMLLTVPQLNPFFYALYGLKFSSGYNWRLYDSVDTVNFSSEATLKRILGINMSTSLTNNLNLSFALIILPILIGFILKPILGFIESEEIKQKLTALHFSCLGSTPFYFIQCFTPLILVSIVVNILLCTEKQPTDFVIMVISILLVLLYPLFFFKAQSTKYFEGITVKVHNLKAIYLVCFEGMKLLTCLILPLTFSSKFSALTITILWLIYTILVQFKVQPYHNSHQIRLALNNLILLCLLSIYTFNEFSSSVNSESEIILYLPFSIVVLITVCFAVNFSFWLYSIKQIRCFQLELDWQNLKVKNSKGNISASSDEGLFAQQPKHQNLKESKVVEVMPQIKHQFDSHQEDLQQQSSQQSNIERIQQADYQTYIKIISNYDTGLGMRELAQLAEMEHEKEEKNNENEKNKSQNYQTYRNLSSATKNDQYPNQNPHSNPSPTKETPISKHTIQKEIKRHLKSNQISPYQRENDKKPSLNKNPDQIYSHLTKNHLKKYKNSGQNENITMKEGYFGMVKKYKEKDNYRYTQKDKYCRYEEYDKT